MSNFFRYQGKNLDGRLVSGSLEGESINEIVDLLKEKEIIPLDIRPEKRDLKEGNLYTKLNHKLAFMTTRVTEEKIQHFFFQMTNLLEAGVPLIQTLNKLFLTEENIVLKTVIAEITKEVVSGNSLSEAFARHNKIFQEIVVPMVQIGENTGRLGTVLGYLALFLGKKMKIKNRLRKAMNYPILVLIFASCAIIGLSYWVIPKFSVMFQSLGISLPKFTIWLLNFSNFITQYFITLIIAIFAFVFGIKWLLKIPRIRKSKDYWILKIPVWGKILLQTTISQFAWMLGLMLRSGVPMLNALKITADALPNRYIGGVLVEIKDKLERGESFSQSLSDRKVFTPIAEQMIEIAEESQQMDEMLTNLGEIYDRELEYATDYLGMIIEPLLLVVVGGVVTIMILGIYFPMWEIIQTMK